MEILDHFTACGVLDFGVGMMYGPNGLTLYRAFLRGDAMGRVIANHKN
jgi:hypothetical protein